jgi:hypothetical protein
MSRVRIFNPASPSPGSGVYRPTLAVGHPASDAVRQRLVGYGIARPTKGRRVLLNEGAPSFSHGFRHFSRPWARNDDAGPALLPPRPSPLATSAPQAPAPTTAKNKPKRRPAKKSATKKAAKKQVASKATKKHAVSKAAKKPAKRRPKTSAAKRPTKAHRAIVKAPKRKKTSSRKHVKPSVGTAIKGLVSAVKRARAAGLEVSARAGRKVIAGSWSPKSSRKKNNKSHTKATAVVKAPKKSQRKRNLTAHGAGEIAGRGTRKLGGLLARAGRAIGRGAAAAARGAKDFAQGASTGIRENKARKGKKTVGRSRAGFGPKHATAVVKAPRKAAKKNARHNKSRSNSKTSAKSISAACATSGTKIPAKLASEIIDRTRKGVKARSKDAAKARALLGKFVEAAKSATRSSKKSTPKARRSASKAVAKAANSSRKRAPRKNQDTKGTQGGTAVVLVKNPPKGRKAQAALASAHKAKAKKAGSTRRSDSVATKKKAKKAKSRSSKRHAARRKHHKRKNQGAVVTMSNKPKRKKAKKAKSSSKKRSHARRKNQGAVVTMNKPKKKRSHAKKRSHKGKKHATRWNDLAKVLGTKGKSGKALWAAIVNKLGRKSRAQAAATKAELKKRAKDARNVEILNKLAQLLNKPGTGVTQSVFAEMLMSAGYDPVSFLTGGGLVPESTSDSEIIATLEQIGLSKDDIKKFRKSAGRKAAKGRRSTAVVAVSNPRKKKSSKKRASKKGAKKSSKKRAHKKSHGKSRKGGHKARGSKKGRKSRKGKKHASKKHAVVKVGGKKSSKKSKKSKKHHRKAANPGLDMVKGYLPAPINENVVNPYASVIKHNLPGAFLGGAATFGLPKLAAQLPFVGSFVQANAVAKILSAAVGGAIGVGALSWAANRFISREAGVEVGKGAAVGALLGFIARSVNALTAPTNVVRNLVGSDADSLSDAVGLSDDKAPAAAPRGQEQGTGPVARIDRGSAEPWSAPWADDVMVSDEGAGSASSDAFIDEAGAPPLGDGLSPQEFDDGDLSDFAAPAMGDFAAPAMGDFAAPAMGDFAAPAMGDFAAPAMDDDMGEPWSGGAERGTWNH